MKILQIHDYPPFEGGGIEVNVSRVSRYMASRGNEITLATGRFASETYIERKNTSITDKDITIILLDSLERLENLINANDIVHIHFTFSCRPASMLALELVTKLGKPTVVSIRTNYAFIPFSALDEVSALERMEKLAKIKRYLQSPSITLSAPSESVTETLKEMGIEKELTVVRNGLADSPGSAKDISVKPVDITFIGKLCTSKGVLDLIYAFRKLVKVFPKLKMRLVGEGPEMKQYYQLVKFFKLDKNILFTGYVDNKYIPAYLKATKIVVHPSFTETWCNAVAEALSFGIPVIATDVEGLKELTSKGDFAKLIPMSDIEALFLAMKEIFGSKIRFKELKDKAEKGKSFVRKNYTIENQSKTLLNLYKKIIDEQSSK